MLRHVVQVLLRRVPSHKDGDETYQRRQDPSAAQHTSHGALFHDHLVLQGTHYGVISVDADATKMENAGGAEVYVQGVPQIAHNRPEEPPAPGELHRSVEGHRAYRNQQIGRRQTDNVTISHHTKSTMSSHAGDHQHIAQNRRDNNATHNDAFDQHHQHICGLREVLHRRVFRRRRHVRNRCGYCAGGGDGIVDDGR